MKINKKGFEFSFGWLFALLVGAAIIFLAIYAAVKLVNSERTVQDTEIAKKLETILTPVETGTEAGKSVEPIVFTSLTRIYNDCVAPNGDFGEQKISIATSSGIGKKWQEPGVPIVSYDKYIFSKPMMEGKQVYLLSKSFNMPYKVASMLFMWTEKYCFVDAPLDIKEDVIDLNLNNINLTNELSLCDKNSKIVCFGENPNCDIIVNENSVEHKGKGTVIYRDSLVYGAIFSEPEIYECQFKRLMKKTSELALLYKTKSINLLAGSSEGCGSNLQSDLDNLAKLTAGVEDSAKLGSLEIIANDLKSKNNQLVNCKLWEDN